ncbi:hypothetical protein [Lentzea sp. NPDC092896]|uniref:hypothetical protein n=1 Tax=Lentzea sp. NPDC092896 TaxID=3364127 RepID=UPI00382EC0AA
MAPTPPQGSAFRKNLFGLKVDRATAALPQTTASPIFTVAGGRVLITGLIGEVTTAIQNQANNTKLIANPTTGSDVDLCAVVDVANLEVGGKLSLTPDLDATPFSVALDKQLAGAIPMGFAAKAICVAAGSIDLSCAASNTGSVKWSVFYVPLDDGATVTAA